MDHRSIDPSTEAREQAETGLNVGRMAVTDNGLWVADILQGELIRVDRDRLRPTEDLIEIGGSIHQLSGDGDDLWVLDTQVGLLTRVDTVSHALRSTRIGDHPTDMAVARGAARRTAIEDENLLSRGHDHARRGEVPGRRRGVGGRRRRGRGRRLGVRRRFRSDS